MTTLNRMSEQFAFWLVQTFLASEEDQTDEKGPLTNKYTLVTGTAVLLVIVAVRLLISR